MRRAVLSALGAAAIGAPAAHASAPMAHEGVHAWEVQTLGVEHADEHAAIRRDERQAARHWARLSPAQRAAAKRRSRAAEQRAAQASAGFPKPPSKVGRWTTPPFSLPTYAIHSALLPTGKVLFWGYPFHPPGIASANEGRAAVWNPRKGTGPGAFDEVDPPKVDLNGDGKLVPAPIWCAGESHLPNGDILVTGGTLVSPKRSNHGQIYTDYAGLLNVFTFDPWTETWQPQHSMDQGRWYPSQVELANGSTMILGGFNEQWPGGIFNQTLDMYSPPASPLGQGRLVSKGEQPHSQTTYPRLTVLPDGKVLMSGPTPLDAGLYDPHTGGWSDYPSISDARYGENAVLEPSGPAGSWQVTLIGGSGWLDSDQGAFRTTETTNASSRNPTWSPGPNLDVQRAWQNTLLLPDGSKVAVGGGLGFTDEAGNYTTSPHHVQRQVDLFDPARNRWHLGPPEVEDRTYHSTALLLPDGRIWSAGDDDLPPEPDGGPSTSDTGEIYSPPYLFKGARPSIAGAPAALSYGQKATVRTGRGAHAKTAVLMAPGAATHSLDTSQRYVKLGVRSVKTHGVRIQAPARPESAPPGYYMLFVLSGDGVPSKASWVRLGGGA